MKSLPDIKLPRADAALTSRLTWTAAVVWVLLIAGSLAWDWAQLERTASDSAANAARVSFQKDVIYRRWAAMHGGVYVPPTEKTPPNPYLADIPDRDVTTTSGKKLTLVNPAYMTRQAHELGREQYGARGHITSLKPIRPENAADPWETRALQAFESGAKEISSVEVMDGESHLRLMRPLMTEQACLKCHAKQGYKVGEIRGGISVSVPMAPFLAATRDTRVTLAWAHGGVGLLGLVGLFLASSRLRRSAQALRESEARWRTIVASDPECIKLLDREGRVVEMNPAGLEMMQASLDQVRGRQASELVAEEDRERFNAMIAAVFRGETQHLTFDMIGLKGRRLTLETTSVPLRDPADPSRVKFLIGVTLDITERKRAEEKLDAHVKELQRWHEATLGREKRVMELKCQVNELCQRLGEPVAYPSQADTTSGAQPPNRTP